MDGPSTSTDFEPFTTPMTNEGLRRSIRANKGLPPSYFGNSVAQLRQSRTRVQTGGENETELQDFPNIPPLTLPKSSAPSVISRNTVRTTASTRKLKLQAELEAAEALAAVKETVIFRRLELKKAEIDEMDDGFLGNDDDSTPSIPDKNHVINIPNNDDIQNRNNEVENWVASTMPLSSVECLAEAFAKAIQTGITMTTTGLDNHKRHEVSSENKIERFLARQTNARDLPNFTGNPEEWPNFISSYRRSTEVCGFSIDENMARLQRSLKGAALQTVQGMMISPENLETVLKTLEMRFGRPDIVIRTLIEKDRKTPSPKEERLEMLITFSNVVQNLVATMRVLKGTSYMLNPELTEELASKMPSHLKLKWGKFVLKQTDPITLEHFADWLDKIANAASVTSTLIQESEAKPVQKRDGNGKKSDAVLTVVEDGKKNETSQKNLFCNICEKSNHCPEKCHQFAKMSTDDRWKIVTEKKLCFHCLGKGCQLIKHSEKKECGVDACNKFHHELLHKVQAVKKEFTAHVSQPKYEVLLRILPVTLRGPKASVDTYALCDEASTVTLMEDSLVENLGLEGFLDPINIQWTNAQTNRVSDSLNVSLSISGEKRDDIYALNNVHTMSDLSLPVQSINFTQLRKKWNYLTKVAVKSLSEAKPQILIGQDNYHLIAPREIVEGPPNAPLATRTKLGWIIHGVNYYRQMVEHTCAVFRANENDDESLHNLVKEHFKLESLGVSANVKCVRSKEEQLAESILESTTRRNSDRWETGLLWKRDDIELPESKIQAQRRLRSLEMKMDRNPDFSEKYCEKMQDFLDKGYARKLSPDELKIRSPKLWYLPHFAHFNPNKPNKLRLILDAASKSNGTSLNDNLLTGPDLYVPLTSVLFKFRQRKIGFGGDIQEMFPQTKIIDDDLPAQRFLWRGKDRSKPADEMVMTRMIFGSVSSPCSAQYVKNRNALEYSQEFPDAVAAITNQHYMDDYFDSTDTVEQAVQKIRSIILVHSKGGWRICNWTCCSTDVLKEIPSDLRCIEDKELSAESELPTERVLGMSWNPRKDEFFFATKFHRVDKNLLNGSSRPTKRGILSVIMSIYDPIGFLHPLTIKGKILMQDIWREGLPYDTPLSDGYSDRWNTWVREVKKVIKSFSVPRCYFPYASDEIKKCLHVFCDASENAMAVVAYITFETPEAIRVAFTMAKSRVAPLAAKSIPRLELEAAVMASRIAATIRQQHNFQFAETHFWSDSKICICWIRSDSKKCRTYVAHRVGEIQETSDASQWHWIPTVENVADEATRDLKPVDLNPTSRWLHGPAFLRLPPREWPKEKGILRIEDFDSDVLEIKKEFVALIHSTPAILILENYSRWLTLIRLTAWVLRFIGRCRKQIPRSLNLTPMDIVSAELYWWRLAQRNSFPEEVSCLNRGKPLPSSSRLLCLSPILDEFGIMRVKGRINESTELSPWTKNPVILDRKHPYTILIGRWYHEQANHYGMETVTNDIRQRFCILQLRTFVKYIWSNCQVCKNFRAQPQIPEMAPLPDFRVTRYDRPFTIAGVDYFGPFKVIIGRRQETRYGCLFTCLSTRAIHIEISESLNTDSAIMALRRFCSRRGNPTEIYSDNGTNFHGADNELKKALLELDQSAIEAKMTNRGIKWNFIPPGSPHMGGCWERLVRSVKTAMGETLKSPQKIEILSTVMCEVEFIINSRPLTHVSIDCDDDEALTPNHFLIGSSGCYQPLVNFGPSNMDLKRKWRLTQHLSDLFWKRWLKEYLPCLTRRTKWLGPSKSIEVDDVVIIADERFPRNCWPKGIVTRAITGKDGKCRVAEVRTKMGLFKRPVTKLCILDVRPKSSDEA